MNNDMATTVLSIVTKIAGKRMVERITLDSRLKQDLGFDSLTMLEVCVEIQGVFNISIEDKLKGISTINDLVTLISDNNANVPDKGADYNIEDYPLPKTKYHIRKLKRYMRLSRFLWRFEISGLDNVPKDGKYILCPNHQSHYDGLWTWTALKKHNIKLNKICVLAKQEHLESEKSKSGLIMLGGIPVDRSGNTVPSMTRALECINDGYTMLIHPEGTRSRDGKMQDFKGGAAKLAIDANVPMIPVRIDGAWDIFPPHRKRPKVCRFGRRYQIKISFGEPISPNGKSVEELTAKLQTEVARLGT